MRDEMTIPVQRGFWWRVLASCLLTFDCFLWATGNPSITGHIGLFWITPIVILMTIAVSAPGRGGTWSPFVLHVLIAGAVCAVLLAAGPYAEALAAERMDAEANSFLKDPISSTAHAPDEQRQLMVKLKRQKYSMGRESFIPTFRRMDYLLTVETGEKYRLTVTVGWTGRPEIWLHRLDN